MEFQLDRHGFSFVAKAQLPSWAGYLDCSGDFGGPGERGSSDGSIEIVFAPEGRDASPLSQREIGLARWVLENESALADAAKTAIFQKYSELQESYEYVDEERAEFMPDISSADDLRKLICLYAINVHQIDKGAVPYLGLEFGCTWDPEHGLGVLMHGTRLIEVGGADTAILLWIAKRDADLA